MISDLAGLGAGGEEYEVDIEYQIPPGSIQIISLNLPSKEMVKFESPKATGETKEALEATNPDYFTHFVLKQKTQGNILPGWPTPKTKYDAKTKTLVAQDFPTAILMLALRSSPPESEHDQAYVYLPEDLRDIEDWVWTPMPGVGFVWDIELCQLCPLSGTALEQAALLCAALRNKSLGKIDPHGRDEVRTAQIFTALHRAYGFLSTSEGFKNLMLTAEDIAGLPEEGIEEVVTHNKKVLWHYILSRSPRFKSYRVVLIYYGDQDDGTSKRVVYMGTVLCSVDEARSSDTFIEDVVAGFVVDHMTPGTDMVAVTDADPGFSAFADHEVWDGHTIAGWIVSPDAKERLDRWDAEVAKEALDHE